MNSSSRTGNCFSPSSVPPLPSSTYPWGTWEDLLLASAVLKHGIDNWSTVSCELQARAFLVPASLFSPEACKGRFWILNGRFSSCSNGSIGDGKIPWFEEVRKLRVAQLKRELELYDGSIGLLQKKLNRLKAERGGSETKTSSEPHEQHNSCGHAPDEVEWCLQVSSTGDRMPAEKPLEIPSDGMLAPETVQPSHTTASPVMTGDGGLETAGLVPALQESSSLERASCNASPIVDQHLTIIEGCQTSDRVNELTTIKVQHETLEPQVCQYSILEVKMSCQDAEDECHVQNGVRPSILASESFEPPTSVIGAQDNRLPATEAVEKVPESKALQHDMSEMEKFTDSCEEREDGGLSVKDAVPPDTVSSDSRAGFERSVDVEVAGFAEKDTGPLCFSAQIESLVNIDVTSMESNQCQEFPARQTGNVLKEDNPADDSLMSASAMDLLRIAYADGTPVSTPEAAEAQPLEPERIEELDGVKDADCFFPLLDHKSVVPEANLINSSVLEVPCKGTGKDLEMEPDITEQNQIVGIQTTVKELEMEPNNTERNQIVGIQTTVHKVSSPNELISVKAAVPDPTFASETEHVSELKVYSVEGLAETNTVLSKVIEISNVKVGIMANHADTELSQYVGVGPNLISKQTFNLELDSEASAIQKGKSSVVLAPQEEIIKPEIQGLGIGGGANVKRCKNLVENFNFKACLEMVEEKGEYKPCEEGCKREVDSVGTEILDISSDRNVSDLNLLDEHAAGTVKEVDDTSQVIFFGSQSVVEPKKRPGTPMDSSSEISGLAFVEHPPVVYGGLYEADSHVQKPSPCDSDGRSSVVETVSESVFKQQKSDPEGAGPDNLFLADNEFLKVSCSEVEGKMPEMVPEAKINHEQPKLEEGSVQMVGSKLSSDPGLSSPRLKAEYSADIDVLEEDGLLVDLMKLKGTDLTNLRKRKHLHRSGSNVEGIKDYGAPKERVDEILAHKQLKLPRSQEEDRKAVQNKDSGSFKKFKHEGRELDVSGENLNQAALSSNVSIIESQDKYRSKESAVEVFSTRRSRLKVRKLESASKEPDMARRRKDGSVKKSEDMTKDGSAQKSEDMILDVGDEESSRLEVSGLVSPDGKPVTRLESTDNRLLPDLVILLECLRLISGHRFAPLFKLRPEIQGDAKYRALIKKHMDLNTVRNKLEEGTYSCSLEFFRDMMLIFSNALVFYSRESQEYGAARVLRESLIREMERYLKKASTHGSMQAVKNNELKVLKDLNMSTSVTTSDGKRPGSIKSSCDHTNCETDLDAEVDTNEVTLVTRFFAKDSGLETTKCVNELDWKKKDRGVKLSSKSLSRVKTTRLKANETEDDRLNMISGLKERVSREKHQRVLEDGNTKLSMKKESVSSIQGSKRPYQISSRSSRDHTPKREKSDKSRSSKYSSGRQVSVPQGRQGEPRKSLGNGRSSRSAQQSKQAYSRGNSASQPQKRARM